jgi:hypothetical protein
MVQFSDSHGGCCSNDGLLWGLITLFRVKILRRAHGRKRAIYTAALIKNSGSEPTTRQQTQRSQTARLEDIENYDVRMDNNKDM